MKTPISIASLSQKLVNVAHKNHEQHSFVLVRYGLERLLYRIGLSEFKDDLVLKGAALFWIWNGSGFRTTKDLDFLGFGDSSLEHIEKRFKALCEMDTLAIDGLVYPQESVRTERIKEEQEYEGVRVTLLAKLGTSRIPLQVDIGFGDSLWPLPDWISFPSLMLLPEPKIRSYTPYTAAAEKFHAICHLGIKTSRMKDFYDLLLILKTQELNGNKFQETVAKTFASRRSDVPTEAPFALTLEFASVPEKSKQWNAFVRKGKLQEPVGSLDETILEIRRLLFPLLTW